jgi:hypothetical protein
MRPTTLLLLGVFVAPASARGQIDSARAPQYFHEADSLCTHEAGRLWGVSLCGPMVFADPVSRSIVTSQPAPDAPRPPALGFANAALKWGDTRWSTYVWQMIPADPAMRRRLFMHELFHRIQPDLGLFVAEPNNDHLDTPEGRYWIQLEWRALARAMADSGAAQKRAVEDALAFRQARRQRFPDAGENERRLEINEGLAQYTGTVSATATPALARADAVTQLEQVAVVNPSFVRTFAYPSGAAYGLLLDQYSPGWTRRIKPTDDLGGMVAAAAHAEPASDADAAALRYGGADLKVAEARRETERQVRIAELRRRFVDGPVLVLPAASGASFITNGITPIPGEGTFYPTYHLAARWGKLDGSVLVSTDRTRLAVPAPGSVSGSELSGDGWTLTVGPGWVVRPGSRTGDYQLVEEGVRPDPHE